MEIMGGENGKMEIIVVVEMEIIAGGNGKWKSLVVEMEIIGGGNRKWKLMAKDGG